MKGPVAVSLEEGVGWVPMQFSAAVVAVAVAALGVSATLALKVGPHRDDPKHVKV